MYLNCYISGLALDLEVDYVGPKDDCVAEVWMQVVDQTSRLESVRNPYSTDRMNHEYKFLSQ